MAMTEEELYDMSDDELEAAFKAAKAQEAPEETDERNEYDEDLGYDEDKEVALLDEPEELDGDDDEEEELLDLEQPDEESDDNSLEDDEEDESEEDSEDEDGELDGEPEADDDNPDEDEDESKDDKQPVQVEKRKYKANGKDFEFSDQEIFDKFGQVFGQAMNYTQKMQQIKPWRQTIDAIEEAKLSHDDVNLAIDVLKGDKEAIAALLKRTGVDALELDTDNAVYTPKNYGRNDAELAIEDIVSEISKDKEYAVTYDVLEKQWDSKSREAFVESPEMIRQLHIDVKSGMFDTISPRASKLKVYDGGSKSDLDYYMEAAGQYFSEQAQNEERQAVTEQRDVAREKVEKVKTETRKRQATKSASQKRKAAAPTKKSAGPKKTVDYLDTSDEDFEEWYTKIGDSV